MCLPTQGSVIFSYVTRKSIEKGNSYEIGLSNIISSHKHNSSQKEILTQTITADFWYSTFQRELWQVAQEDPLTYPYVDVFVRFELTYHVCVISEAL